MTSKANELAVVHDLNLIRGWLALRILPFKHTYFLTSWKVDSFFWHFCTHFPWQLGCCPVWTCSSTKGADWISWLNWKPIWGSLILNGHQLLLRINRVSLRRTRLKILWWQIASNHFSFHPFSDKMIREVPLWIISRLEMEKDTDSYTTFRDTVSIIYVILGN